MAKIKQIKMRLEIDPSRPWKETVVSIHYDSTDRRTEQFGRPIPEERFYIVLPDVVADALGSKEVRATDQAEVMKRFDEELEKYKCMSTEVNKVILYAFDVIPKPDGSTQRWDNYAHRVSIVASVYSETVMIAGDGNKRYSYECVESEIAMGREFGSPRDSGERRENQVPWNEKNQAFFLWIKKNMEILIERLSELEQPDDLIEAIHAGRLLPLGNQASKVRT